MYKLTSKSYWRIFLLIFLDLVFIISLYYAYVLLSFSPPNQWIIGDWLINYHGGMVRRGLPGEVLFRVSQLFEVDIDILVVVFQILVYSTFLVKVYKLSINSIISALTAAMILSPAFILFQILDPQGSFRKEILLFAFLSALCCNLAYSDHNNSKWTLFYTGIASILIVLSHEMLVVYLPYVLCAFIIYEKGLGAKAKKAVLFIAPAILIAVFLIIFKKGDRQIVTEICKSLDIYAPLDCVYPDSQIGSISFLAQDISSAHNFVLNSLGETGIAAYSLTAILSFMPLVLIFFSKQTIIIRENKKMQQWLALCTCSALIGSIPLFWIVADYGRIIYIHVTCLSLLTLLISQKKDGAPQLQGSWSAASWIFLLLFISSWRLVHFEASIENAFPVVTNLLESFFRR